MKRKNNSYLRRYHAVAVPPQPTVKEYLARIWRRKANALIQRKAEGGLRGKLDTMIADLKDAGVKFKWINFRRKLTVKQWSGYYGYLCSRARA